MMHNMKKMLKFLHTIIILLIASNTSASQQSQDVKHRRVDYKLNSIEREYHIKAGVYAQDTNNEQVIAYRANDKFPFQSTCKFIGVSALLAQDANAHLLQKKVLVGPHDILYWHPISGKYVNQKVPLQTLAEGAITYSSSSE